MAAGGVSSTIQDLEEITNCVVCLETYIDPRTLPCLHILCNQCIQGLIQKANDERRSTINCPLCQKNITIPHPHEMVKSEFHRSAEDAKTLFGKLRIVGDKSSLETSLRTVKIISTINLNTKKQASGIATTMDGKVILALFDSPNILTVNKDGSQVLTQCEHLKKAYDLKCHDGNIYISDSDCKNGDIHVYSMNMKYCKTIAGFANGSFPSFSIFGDNVYMCSFDRDAVYDTSLHVSGAKRKKTVVKHSEMISPCYVCTNGSTIVVCCYTSNNVLSFSMTGQLNFAHGGLPKGRGDTQLDDPSRVVIDRHGCIIVADINNKRLVILSESGQVDLIIPLSGKPCALTLDNKGNILVTTVSPWQLLTIDCMLSDE